MSRTAKRLTASLTLVASALLLQGCLAAAVGGAVVGTAVGVTGAVVGTGVKATGAVVGAAIPDGDKDRKDRERPDR